MKRTNFPFKGFYLTIRDNNFNILALIVADDIAASALYPALEEHFNFISIDCVLSGGYFDLFIRLNDTNEFFELNFHEDDKTKELAKSINEKSVTELWIVYPQKEKYPRWGSPFC